MSVFVLDKRKRPLMTCSEKRARKMLSKGQAVVHKMHPFTIRHKTRLLEHSVIQAQELKIDDGAKQTGIAITLENRIVKHLGEVHHRQNIKEKLETRSGYRRTRRRLKCGYRRNTFAPAIRKEQKIESLELAVKNLKSKKSLNEAENRSLFKVMQKLNRLKKQKSAFKTPRPDGWLPPSIIARKNQTVNTVKALMKLTPISGAYVEQVKFDMQKLENGGISGTEYQQGTLLGYTIREYLLEAHNRTCQYCGDKNTPLEVEHKKPRSRGGSDKISNLTLSCVPCNREKDDMLLAEWAEKIKSKKRKSARDLAILAGIETVSKEKNVSYKHAAVVNMTRIALVKDLKELLPRVFTSDGATTKMNRIASGLPKTHYYDALCVFETPALRFDCHYVAVFKANGRGSRVLPRTNACGIKIHGSEKQRRKGVFGFVTGDIVKAVVEKGKKKGAYVGRIAVKASGYFALRDMRTGILTDGVNHKFMTRLQRNTGWEFAYFKRLLP